MKLEGFIWKILRDVLSEAFPNEGALSQMVSFNLNEKLEKIVDTEQGLESIIYELIDVFASRDEVSKLVKGAFNGNPTNVKLIYFCQAWRFYELWFYRKLPDSILQKAFQRTDREGIYFPKEELDHEKLISLLGTHIFKTTLDQDRAFLEFVAYAYQEAKTLQASESLREIEELAKALDPEYKLDQPKIEQSTLDLTQAKKNENCFIREALIMDAGGRANLKLPSVFYSVDVNAAYDFHNASPGLNSFSINLVTGGFNSDIVHHLAFRLNEELLVQNTQIDSNWKIESRKRMPACLKTNQLGKIEIALSIKLDDDNPNGLSLFFGKNLDPYTYYKPQTLKPSEIRAIEFYCDRGQLQIESIVGAFFKDDVTKPPEQILTPDERLKLIRTLNSLLPQQLEELIVSVNPPGSVIPPATAAQGDRTAALIRWAESPNGIGLQTVQDLLEQILNI